MEKSKLSSNSSDIFEPALSNSASSASISGYSYYSKQQELLKLIQSTHLMLTGICADHRADRFPLIYPKFSESVSSSRSRSRSGRDRFQLIGLSGTRTSNTPQSPLTSDLSVLEEASLGRLLAGKLDECREYLDRMLVRVRDRSSRVLVTGDVNGGKSSLINAFLRQSLLPMDQQPCTEAFCEVIPGAATDTTVVNAIPDYDRYDANDSGTFDLMSISRMQQSVQEQDYQWFRIYLPVRSDISLLCNELVQVSLIDSPGLNSDLFKTMNLFTRQEEIDVVVFVINAANHLTLSAREFLETAGRDKAYIFIVVNKFDDIRNKDKCRRSIQQQIAEVLPATAAESSDLIHFVSSKVQLFDSSSSDSLPTQPVMDAETEQLRAAFSRLEACLGEFILSKRATSKLLPAKTYLLNLLTDLQILLEYNERCCQEEVSTVRRQIDILTPCYEELVKREAPLRQDLLHGVTDASNMIYHRTNHTFDSFESKIREIVAREPWSGIMSIWTWRRRILLSVQQEAVVYLKDAQKTAMDTVTGCLEYLQATSISNAGTVYSREQALSSDVVFETVDVHALTSLPTWSLLDLRVSRTMLVAGSSLLLTPFLSLSKLSANLLLLNLSPRPILLATITVLTALSTLTLLIDTEPMARSKLVNHLLAHYAQPTWRHLHCHSIESACHQHLVAVSGSLLSKFQEALQQQRRMRAEKDLERARLAARLEQIVGVSRRITGLHDSVHSLVI